MGNLISARELEFSYLLQETPVLILNGISIDIEAGSFVCIVGHNGSGKSTFAKSCNAILQPTAGKLYVAEMDTSDENKIIEIRKTVGMVFQNPDNQIVANVVEEDVAFAPENLGVPPQEIRERVDTALLAVGMEQFKTHAPHMLSGGQKQRVAIAGVIAMQPKCIVLDEPTAMIDPAGRKEVLNAVKKLNKEYGITIILITHHMNEAALADRLIVMNDGEIFLDGPPREIFVKVDEMKSVGLTVPDTIELLYELRKNGLELSLEALEVDGCARIIYDALLSKTDVTETETDDADNKD